jgi:SAM-dependent methyltransferase
MSTPGYHVLREHYERCLATHGDNHLGVNWSRLEDAEKRYEVMLDLLPPVASQEPLTLLDFGCGAAHFYDFIQAHGRTDIVYAGLDISEPFVALSRQKHPALAFYCQDFLLPTADLPMFDFIVLNGVFTNKSTLAFAEMWDFTRQLLTKLVPHARRGLAFNVMSKHVDWEREELFHLPLDTLATFFHESGWRQYVIRSDYGLYDYTVYLLR